MNKEIWKKALVGFLPICFIILIILCSIYLVALIVPDTIDQITAESIGYGVIAGIIVLSLLAILYIRYSDMQREELLIQHEVDNRTIERLEVELKRLQNKK